MHRVRVSLGLSTSHATFGAHPILDYLTSMGRSEQGAVIRAWPVQTEQA